MAYNSVLFISDLHCPFQHKDTKPFLKAIKKKYKPELIVCLGDEIDGHTISFHDDEPDLPYSPSSELDAAIDELHDNVINLFPKALVCDSNHGSLIYRRARKHKIPVRALKDWADVLETPGWHWSDRHIIPVNHGSPILAVHGFSAVAAKLSKANGMSTIEGHFHEKFEVVSWRGANQHKRFAVKTGCMIDNKSLAFRYNKLNVNDVMLGHTIWVNGVPKLLPMFTDEKNRWIGLVP